jgi:F1F0 ATPase subunit 2
MSLAFHVAPPAWAVLPVLAACLLGGLGLGALYFRTLWWSTRRFGVDGSLTTAVALMAGRFLALGAVLFLASLAGAAPLLTMALGLLIARFAVVRRVRISAP